VSDGAECLTAMAAAFPVAAYVQLPLLRPFLSPLRPPPATQLVYLCVAACVSAANPLAAAKLSLVVVTHCVLVMRHTQRRCRPKTQCFQPIDWLLRVFVSSVNVCAFNYGMSDKLKIKFTTHPLRGVY